MGKNDDFGAFDGFDEAADGVMTMLKDMLKLEVWFVTRARLDEWIVTHLRGAGPFVLGDSLPIPSAVRDRILRGRRPAFNDAPTRNTSTASTNSGALDGAHTFIGAPLIARGELYGVVVGLASGAQWHDDLGDAPHLMTAARILSTILDHELDADELLRRAERAEAEALVDELTRLFNRRGWDRLVEREEKRSLRYGHSATVFMIDVDGLKRANDEGGHAVGDTILRKVADVMRVVTREHDVAARLGGDEFALLAVETGAEDSRGLEHRVETAFSEARLAVSIGSARREHRGGITAAIARADAQMYQQKARRRNTAVTANANLGPM